MSELKTKANDGSVDAFINSINDSAMKQDSIKLIKLFTKVTGARPVMWGSSIIGFGSYHYKYSSGKEADWLATGFSPRKQNLTIYIMNGFDDYEKLLSKLGNHKLGKSCLYIKKLSDINIPILEELISKSVDYVRNTFDQKA